ANITKQTQDDLKAAASAIKLTAASIDLFGKVPADSGAYASALYANVLRNYVQGTGASADPKTGLPQALPQCNTTFNGTIKSTVPAATVGLLIQQGDAYIGGNTNVGGNIYAGGNVSATQVLASQGVSAYGGAITLGNPDLTSYQTGITIGGGSVAGAGTG